MQSSSVRRDDDHDHDNARNHDYDRENENVRARDDNYDDDHFADTRRCAGRFP